MSDLDDTFTAKDKIGILMKEYDTLRAEILARTNAGFQLVAIGAGVFALSVGRQNYTVVFWLLVAVGVATLLAFTCVLFRDTRMCAERIREIEAQVNRLANDDLLKWESNWGGSITGIVWRRTRPLKRATTDDRVVR